MSRAPAIRQRDLAAALKAMIAAGMEVRSVELDPVTGKIIILTLTGAANEPTTDLDRWIAKHAC
jgi:hypothetical protein